MTRSPALRRPRPTRTHSRALSATPAPSAAGTSSKAAELLATIRGHGGSPRASWDAHENVQDNHSTEAGRIDKPIAGLLRDLKQRGMLDDTLVLLTTEFGRTPFAQSNANQVGPGRDHNKYGFSCWLAGGGVKAGFSYGKTDEIGWKTVENPVHWHDFHATVLHLMGVDHKKLNFYHNGIERRLTDVHGHVAEGIFA